MSRPLGIPNHDPLRTEHLILSLWKQAQMIHANREGAKVRLKPEYANMVRQARNWLTEIMEAERRR